MEHAESAGGGDGGLGDVDVVSGPLSPSELKPKKLVILSCVLKASWGALLPEPRSLSPLGGRGKLSLGFISSPFSPQSPPSTSYVLLFFYPPSFTLHSRNP